MKRTLLLALGGCLTISGCSDDGGGSSKLTISAQVGSDYNVAYTPTLTDHMLAALVGKPAMALNSGANVDQVVAIPTTEGTFVTNMLHTADIANDGRFSLSLERSYGWVLLLVDSQAISAEQKVGAYVTARVTQDDTLVAYSADTLSGSLDLGVLSQSGNEAVGSSANAFALSLDDIKAVAQSDDAYKHLINDYLNYDEDKGTGYTLQPIFNWSGPSLTTLGNVDAPANSIASYQSDGLQLNLQTNDTATLNLPDGICDGSQNYTLYPPSTILDTNGMSYDANSGMGNDGSSPDNNIGSSQSGNWLQDGRYYCYDHDFGMQWYGSGDNALFGFSGANANLLVPAQGMPEGQWLLKHNGNTVAWFDLAISAPLDSAGHLVTPFPSLRINHESDGRITSVEVHWHIYDAATAQYVTLNTEQLQAIDHLIAHSFISMHDEDGPDINTPQTIDILGGPQYSNALVQSIDLGENTAYLSDSSGDVSGNLVPTLVKVGYHLGGIEYQFGWNN